jgi:hypothetical protein
MTSEYPTCERRVDGRCTVAEDLIQIYTGQTVPVPAVDSRMCVKCIAEGGPEPTTRVAQNWAVVACPTSHRVAFAKSLNILGDEYPVPLPEGVGKEFADRIKKRLHWPTCNLCYATAQRMNSLGVSGCRREFDSLVKEVQRNASVLLPLHRDWRAWVLRMFPEGLTAEMIGELLTASIAAVEARPETFSQSQAAPKSSVRSLLTIDGSEPVEGKLAVVAALFNPASYSAIADNWRHWRATMQPLLDSGRISHCITAEALYGDQLQTVDADDIVIIAGPDQVCWQKERLLNIAIASLPDDVTAVAWIDADLTFLNPAWPEDTLRALTTFDSAQLFAQALMEDSLNGTARLRPATMAQLPHQRFSGIHRPGYAWAARRDRLTGGLYDACMSGSGDYQMLCQWTGRADRLGGADIELIRPQLAHVNAWAKVTEVRTVGHVPGTVVHHWHGKWSGRGYVEKNELMAAHRFDPVTDIEIAPNGLYRWTDPTGPFAVAMMDHFRTRNDDNGRIIHAGH